MMGMYETLEPRTLLAALQTDITFGVDGHVEVPFPAPPVFVREQSDGSILTVGATDDVGTNHVAFARFTSTGAPDSTFGTNGLLETFMIGKPLAAADYGKGRIVILIQQGNNAVIARFKSTGALDKVFSDDGRITVATGSAPLSVGSIAVADNGDVAATGFFQTTNTPFLLRVTGEGKFDSTFDDDGKAVSVLRPYALAIDSQNRIVLSGFSGDDPMTGKTGEVARYTADGTLDASFGSNGVVDFDSTTTAFTRVILETDDSILVAGISHGSFNATSLARLQANGDNVTFFPTTNAGSDELADLGLDRNSGVVTVLTTQTVQRFAADGTRDESSTTASASLRNDGFHGNTLGLAANGDLLIVATDLQSTPVLTRLTTADRPATFLSASGTLYITGTESADTIGIKLGTGEYRVRRNGRIFTFPVASVQHLQIQTLGGNDVVDWSGISQGVYCEAGTGNDSVTAGSGADSVSAVAGKDTVSAGGGNDLLNGNGGNDQLSGDAGADRLHGNDGNDVILGNAGVDRLFGEAGDDLLIGGNSNDKLYGDIGKDTLDGGSGADIIAGNGGIDSATADSLDTQSGIENVIA